MVLPDVQTNTNNLVKTSIDKAEQFINSTKNKFIYFITVISIIIVLTITITITIIYRKPIVTCCVSSLMRINCKRTKTKKSNQENNINKTQCEPCIKSNSRVYHNSRDDNVEMVDII